MRARTVFTRLVAALILSSAALPTASLAAVASPVEDDPPPVIIDIDCLRILDRVLGLIEAMDMLNVMADDAWEEFWDGDITLEELEDRASDIDSMASDVEQAYEWAKSGWLSNACLGQLPALPEYSPPWADWPPTGE